MAAGPAEDLNEILLRADQREKEEAAAIKIQSLYRGGQVRTAPVQILIVSISSCVCKEKKTDPS